MTVTPHDVDDANGDFCQHCCQWRGSTARYHKAKRELEVERMHREDLERGLRDIIYTLKEAQPAPRTMSVNYVAGYARAMDDIRLAVLAAVERHEANIRQTQKTIKGVT